MLTQNDLSKARMRSIFLTLLMVLSTTAALATTASVGCTTYTTNRDPMDVAIGDFDCDGHNDMAVATDGTHSMTILYNDGFGNFNEREDIWVAAIRAATPTGTSSPTSKWSRWVNLLAIRPLTSSSTKEQPVQDQRPGRPAGEPGNVTIIENGGCNNRDWTIGERFSHFWVWDMTVGDADQDGNDDITSSTF